MNLAFSIDSILVAVAMSPKIWVILSGGLLGIVAMRIVVGQLLSLVRRYPSLVDAAFIIIAWIGVKLLVEYLHQAGLIHFEINKWLSFGLIAVIFGVAYVYAMQKGPIELPATTARPKRCCGTSTSSVSFRSSVCVPPSSSGEALRARLQAIENLGIAPLAAGHVFDRRRVVVAGRETRDFESPILIRPRAGDPPRARHPPQIGVLRERSPRCSP